MLFPIKYIIKREKVENKRQYNVNPKSDSFLFIVWHYKNDKYFHLTKRKSDYMVNQNYGEIINL